MHEVFVEGGLIRKLWSVETDALDKSVQHTWQINDCGTLLLIAASKESGGCWRES